SLTFVPAAVALLVRGPVATHDTPVMRGAARLYAPLLRSVLRWRGLVIGGALLLVLGFGLLASRLGTEFIPDLDEGDIAVHAMRIPGTSLTQAVGMQRQLERRIAELSEVSEVVSRIGTGEVATDPMPPSVADTYVLLKDRSQWPDRRKPRAQLQAELEHLVEQVHGNNYEFTQPVQMRMNELIAGVRAEVAINVHGDDLAQLVRLGAEVERIAAG